MDDATPLATADNPDGRRARRDRNRAAVVDALLGLYREGNLAPSSVEIAGRAGLSPRSLFRYFDDIDDLARAAIARQSEQVWTLAEIDVSPDEPLDARIETFVQTRVRLFEAIGAVGRVARLREPFQPLVARQLGDARAMLRGQIPAVFGPELGALATDAADELVAAIDVLASYEAYRLLRFDQELSSERAGAVLRATIDRLLGGASNNAERT